MSERDVELYRRFTEAYNARNVEAMIACCDPNVEWHSTFAAVGGVYRGHGGVRKWHRDLEEAWGGELRIESEVYFDVGERTLGFYVLHGRGRYSGAEVAVPSAAIGRSRDGLIVYLKAYADREDALRDLGVSEDELEPITP
jgi:ketosteroid isomerase-like protein